RFCRAYGGWNQDGDSLCVAFRVGSEADVIDIFSVLQIPLVRLPPLSEVQYPEQEFVNGYHRVGVFPNINQPGNEFIAGEPVFIWIYSDRVKVSVTDDKNIYIVTDKAVRRAKLLEKILKPLENRIIDPPNDDEHCICPKYYPDFWSIVVVGDGSPLVVFPGL